MNLILIFNQLNRKILKHWLLLTTVQRLQLIVWHIVQKTVNGTLVYVLHVVQAIQFHVAVNNFVIKDRLQKRSCPRSSLKANFWRQLLFLIK
ncbi:hypothetical protein CER22_32205 [Bacillus sp. K2I17]|nr:hypothetical protein CER22_32205 [Bacillus sp. K2I17]